MHIGKTDGKHPGKKIIEAHGLACISKKHFTTDTGDRFSLRLVATDPLAPEKASKAIESLLKANFVSRIDENGFQIFIGPSFEVIKFVPRMCQTNLKSLNKLNSDECRNSHTGNSQRVDDCTASGKIHEVVSRLQGRGGQDSWPNKDKLKCDDNKRKQMAAANESAKPYGSGCPTKSAASDCTKNDKLLSSGAQAVGAESDKFKNAVTQGICANDGEEFNRGLQRENLKECAKEGGKLAKTPKRDEDEKQVGKAGKKVCKGDSGNDNKLKGDNGNDKLKGDKGNGNKRKGENGNGNKRKGENGNTRKGDGEHGEDGNKKGNWGNKKGRQGPKGKGIAETSNDDDDSGRDLFSFECDASEDNEKMKKPYCDRPIASVLKGRNFKMRETFHQYAEENLTGAYCQPDYKEPIQCYSKRERKERLCPVEEEEAEAEEEHSLDEADEYGERPNPEICQTIRSSATARGVATLTQRDLEGDQRVKGKLSANKGNAKTLNIAFLMRYFPKFCEEHHFLSMLLNLRPLTTSRHEGMVKALDLQTKLDYFCKTEAQRRIGFEDFEETLMDPKVHLDYVDLVTDHEIKDWQLLKLPHTENRVVMREGDLIVDTRNTALHFYIDVFSRGAGDKYVRNGVMIDKLKHRVDIGQDVYRARPGAAFIEPQASSCA
ncbi:unnamed protein product [Notodromas monacha]|uniref:Uncharacterized protein n=1 Tax=Notodromas monacha TaxID=399045 RepID=A0A7R9BEI1_9CRUS|nr:unnamed protein product [Notodromas monacha]CAG0912677.1 unnamed protein product [Notodromas monacha]